MVGMGDWRFRPIDWIAAVSALALALASNVMDNSIIFALGWLVAGAVLTLAVMKHDDIRLLYRLIISIGIMSLSIGVSYGNYKINYEKSIMITSGILYPGDEKRPSSTVCRSQIPDNALAIYFGSNVAWTSGDKITLILINKSPLIQFERHNSGIRLTNITILDDRSQVAAVASDNGFDIKPIAKGKMPTKNNIYITDYKGVEIFNINLLNSLSVKISGVFAAQNGIIARISDVEVAMPEGIYIAKLCLGEFTGSALAID